MNVLPSAGGLGGGAGAEGGTGAAEVKVGLGAMLGFVGITIEVGGGTVVVVGGSGAGGAADPVDGFSPNGGAGLGVGFVISGCFDDGGDERSGVVPFALGSSGFRELTAGSGNAGEIFGPAEGAPVADLLEGAEIREGTLPELVGVGGEGGGKDPELRARIAPLPPVWVIDAADGFCTD